MRRWFAGGVNFSLFSRNATGVELLFFDREDDAAPGPRDSHRSRRPTGPTTTGTCSCRACGRDRLYGYRVDGPVDPRDGLRFDPAKVLLDPYGRGVVVPKSYSREAARREGDNAATAMKSVVVDPRAYDWEGDAPLRPAVARAPSSTRCTSAASRATPVPASPEKTRGHLCRPDREDSLSAANSASPPWNCCRCSSSTPRMLRRDGSTTGAMRRSRSSRRTRRTARASDPLGPVNEFRDMVKALHRAGIEVILDVVFNHTAEGDHRGPTLSFRGLDNPPTTSSNADRLALRQLHRLREHAERQPPDRPPHDRGQPALLGGGNARRRLPLRPRVDPGARLVGPPDAEPAGALGYRVGPGAGRHEAHRRGVGRGRALPGRAASSATLEGVERPVPRRCPRLLPRRGRTRCAALPTGLLGSPEIYGHKEREAEQSVNFVTCHDGFTLNDLVSYNQKHNEANGEDNRDGADDNRSWNCGVEGPTDDPAVEKLRNRQVKNFLTVTMLSLGVPMILMGDEVRRTQRGNNNAYCQDNETSWFDWTLLEKHADVHRFVSLLIARRLLRDVEHERQRVEPEPSCCGTRTRPGTA